MTSQRFCLRWNNHQTNLLSVFDQLLLAETFTDVTLAVDGQYLKAHKMVLSACSPYFQKLFLNHPEIHPIVILKDIPYTDVKSLLDFMYRGEVSVDQERLTAFLRIAETLKIKGLTEVHEDKPVSAASTPAAASPNLNQINPYISQQQQTQQQQQQQQQQQLRKQQGMALHNPLLGSALTGPKRKRGRPRKFSGSDIGDEYEEFERENLVQGSPELMEMRMGTEGFSTDDNGISRSGDNDDSNDAMDTSEAMHKTSKDQRKDDTTSDSNQQQQQQQKQQQQQQNQQQQQSSPNLAAMINARPPLATASNFAANKTNEAQQHQQQHQQQQQQHQQQQQQQHQQQQQNLLLQHFQQQHKPPVAMSSPKIRVNPNTQNPTTSQVSNVLQQLQNDTFNNNNNNNNNNPQMTSLLENKSNTASNSNNSNGLMSALQLTAVSNNSTNSIQNLLTSPARMQWLVMPAGSSTPNNGSPSTPSKSQQELMQSIGLTNVNNTPKPEPNTSPACSLRPPMRRRVRRKGSSPDDQAEQLTEMSVRGLNLFRYASICDGVYQCTECLKDNVQKTFKNKYSFQRHAFLYHEGTQRKVFPCPLCGKEFSRPDKMKNHMKTTHEGYMPKDFPLTGDGTQLPQVVGQPSTSPNKSKLGDKKPLLLQPHQLMSSENMYSLAQTQLQLQQIQAHLQIQQQKQSHNFGMMSPQGKQGSPDPSASPNGPQDQRPSPIESPLLVPKTEDLTIDLDDGESSSPLPFNVDEIQSSTLLQTEQENVA